MSKKIIFTAIVMVFILAASGVQAAMTSKSDSQTAVQPLDAPTTPSYESTKDRLSRGMNNILYGPMEMADNLNETKTKGQQMSKCSTKTRSGFERGIARVVGGVWQLATFWYSDPGCVTKAPVADTKKTK